MGFEIKRAKHVKKYRCETWFHEFSPKLRDTKFVNFPHEIMQTLLWDQIL